ncbi:MAG: acyl-CoA dehydrogenase [Acidimicrobiia bacterium]|nr:acyl-CoA dehydrogenase [Acidimicrobiia bacterium]
MADAELRNNDFSLSDDQETLRATFASFFERESPIDRVRSAEPLGFDEKLWQQLVSTGVPTMGLPPDRGGDGAGLVELALVAEQAGYRLAPVPLVPVVTAARLLARCGNATTEWLAAIAAGTRRVALAVHPARAGEAQLVPGGAVADGIVGFVENHLVLATRSEPASGPRNIGSEPLTWWDPGDPHESLLEVASGAPARASFDDACREWRLLSAATLVGMAQAALDLAVQYAKDRVAFGVPIGTFQAIAHPLVDVAGAVQGARHLAWKAAWLADHEPEQAPAEMEMAYLHSCRAAQQATAVGIHTQGGFGFTLESDMQLYFRRAKSAALLAGDPRARLAAIADHLYGPAQPELTGQR